MTPREPSEEAVVAALKSWFGCDVQDLPGIKRAYAADMRRALRAAYATIASQAEALAAKEVEIERLKDFEPDYHRSRAELMQHFEARIAAEAALKAAREALEHLADDFHNDWSKDTRHETIRAVEKFAKERLAALSPPTKEPGKAGGEVG